MQEYKEIIGDVAAAYWGAPNLSLSKPGRELRFGTHGSKSVDLIKGTWFDHELNIGGGAADLVRIHEPDARIVDRLEAFGLPKSGAQQRSERVYDYTRQDGSIAYQVVRIDTKDGKTYRQRRVDEDTGEIVWGMTGVTALPYRLHDLAQSTAAVFIVEGEKCADAVAHLGLVATTNHGGAGKWWPPLTEYFHGRNVVIIPDNDAPGEKHARVVADALTGTAKSIRILRLPDLGKKGDVADWIAAGHTKEQLTKLAKAAPLYDPLRQPEIPAEAVEERKPEDIKATPFKWADPASIPRRRFIYAKHYIRQFVSLDVAPGGVGKSSLAIVEALAIATGRSLLGVKPDEQGRVWYYNGEDPMDEIQRRVMAAVKHYGIAPEELEGRLFLDSGRSMPMIVGEQTREGAIIQVPVVNAVVDAIRANKIDVMTLDPFVSTHHVTENDNNAIERVAKTWARIADVTNCAINLVHHSRKTGGNEVSVEDGRGASALLSAARAARSFNQMSEDEARKAGVDNRRLYFRTDNGKANLAPPPDGADWYRLLGVPLGNGPGGTDGDVVGVVTAWQWPDMMDGVTVNDLRAAQREVADGGPWRASAQAKDWVGVPIARALNIDLATTSGKAKVASLLKTWVANGMFVEVRGKDGKRMERTFVEVGEWAND